MNLKHKTTFITLLLITLHFAFIQNVNAATMSLFSDKRAVKAGDEIVVNVEVDTNDASINAVQGTIQFQPSLIEVETVDKTDSAFNFWIQEPTFSNKNGDITFIGGTTKGISGKSLQVFQVKMKAKATGTAEITLADAVVTSNDGKGTNVLSDTVGVTVGIGTGVATSSPVSASVRAPTIPVVQPVVITRTPTIGTKVPQSPNVTVPLYPSVSTWYNYLGDAIALWDVPSDVTKVYTALTKSPNTVPDVAESELTTGKDIGTIKDGIWYFHAQFKNNVGFGGTSHYKISLDTTPPVPFITKILNSGSDSPSLQISFNPHDALSGIDYSLIFVDGNQIMRSNKTSETLPPQGPGKHKLSVRAFDKAGNSTEDTVDFEILALPSPVIEFIAKSIDPGQFIFASGKSIPNSFIDVSIVNSSKVEVFKSTVLSDSAGNWKITDKVLPTDSYDFSVTARDDRGAMSFPVKDQFKVHGKTIISIGGIDLGWFEIFVLATLIVITAGSLISWKYVSEKNTRDAYKIIVGRDVEKLSNDLTESLEQIKSLEDSKSLDSSVKIKAATSRMKETTGKMKKYLSDEINKLK